VLEALTAINAELGTTTVIITHNAVIREIAHRVIYFADGRIDRIEVNAARRAPAEVSW
jgi:putative ABC transport system ATP-binding protein